jgi:hypothetical protein
MKPALLFCALLLLPVLARAETIDLGTHGTLSITAPKGWKVSSKKAEETGIAVVFTPPPDVNASLILNLVFVPKGEPTSKDDVHDKVLSAADQFVDSSVEKKKVLHDFALSGGAYGAYCAFTDASLVGQAPQKDNFKVVALGIVRFNEDVSASVSLLCDDLQGPDFAAMLAAVSSAVVTTK